MMFDNELEIVGREIRCEDYDSCKDRCDGRGNIYQGEIKISSCLCFRIGDLPYMNKQTGNNEK